MRRMLLLALAITLLLVPSQLALAQDGGHDMNMSGQTPSMPGMAHDAMSMQSDSFIASVLQHATSGTDAEPNSTPFPMLMTTKGNWTLMFHGEGFLSEIAAKRAARPRQAVFHQLVDADGAAKIREGHADPQDHAQLRTGHGLGPPLP